MRLFIQQVDYINHIYSHVILAVTENFALLFSLQRWENTLMIRCFRPETQYSSLLFIHHSNTLSTKDMLGVP